LSDHAADLDALGFITKFTKELTQYPESATKDLVMADWQAEWNMARIIAAGRRTDGPAMADARLPSTCGGSSTRYRCAPRRCPREGSRPNRDSNRRPGLQK
jgi:hypothetical protein